MPYKMQKLEEGIRAAASFIDAVNKKDAVLLESLLDDHCVLQTWCKDEIVNGKKAVCGYYSTNFLQNPRLSITVKEIHNMGKKCILLCSIHNEDSDSLNIPGMMFFEVRNAKIISMNFFTKN